MCRAAICGAQPLPAGFPIAVAWEIRPEYLAALQEAIPTRLAARVPVRYAAAALKVLGCNVPDGRPLLIPHKHRPGVAASHYANMEIPIHALLAQLQLEDSLLVTYNLHAIQWQCVAQGRDVPVLHRPADPTDLIAGLRSSALHLPLRVDRPSELWSSESNHIGHLHELPASGASSRDPHPIPAWHELFHQWPCDAADEEYGSRLAAFALTDGSHGPDWQQALAGLRTPSLDLQHLLPRPALHFPLQWAPGAAIEWPHDMELIEPLLEAAPVLEAAALQESISAEQQLSDAI